MAVKKTKSGKWALDIRMGRKKRYQKVLPETVKTKEQAEAIEFDVKNQLKSTGGHILKFKETSRLFNEALTHYEKIENHETILGMKNFIISFTKYLENNQIFSSYCLAITPSLVEYYVQDRKKISTPKAINKELFFLKRIHNFWVSKGYCMPLNFDLTRFYVRDRRSKVFFSEKFYEKLIEKYPLKFLNENFRFIEKPPKLKRLIPDSIFASEDDDYIIVEIQKFRLDRTHAYKILEYRDKLQEIYPDKNIRMIEVVIGDICSDERKRFLDKYGVELILLPIERIEETLSEILFSNSK